MYVLHLLFSKSPSLLSCVFFESFFFSIPFAKTHKRALVIIHKTSLPPLSLPASLLHSNFVTFLYLDLASVGMLKWGIVVVVVVVVEESIEKTDRRKKLVNSSKRAEGGKCSHRSGDFFFLAPFVIVQRLDAIFKNHRNLFCGSLPATSVRACTSPCHPSSPAFVPSLSPSIIRVWPAYFRPPTNVITHMSYNK